jgi:hypothetical protein
MPDWLRNPDWWFTGLLLLILASVFGSYLRDAVWSALARVSCGLRDRRTERQRRDRQRVELLASNPDLLLAELMRCLFLIVLFMGLVGFYLFFALLSTTMAHLPDTRGPGVFTLDVLAKGSLVIGAALGLCSIYFGFPLAPRVTTVMRARAEFENRCKRRISAAGGKASASTPVS